MRLSNRILASFIIVFIIAIIFGTQFALKEIDKLTGAGLVEQANISVTISNICGDNNLFGTEQCDGGAPANTTCVTRGFDGGTLLCSSTCTFVTSSCTNITEAAAVAGEPETGGFPPAKLVYDSNLFDTYDFAITRVRTLYIIFKGVTHTVNLHSIGNSATLKISSSETIFLEFEIGQTRPLDIDGDGILDFQFTLSDTLTRRAVFHIEKFKSLNVKLSQKQKASLSEPTLETPLRFEDYRDYYLDAALLLTLIILAIINFAIFKKFITSKK